MTCTWRVLSLDPDEKTVTDDRGASKGCDRLLRATGGTWVVQFHNISVAAVDGGKLEATGLSATDFFDEGGNDTTCDAAMNMALEGTFNGEPGWSVIFRAGDAGHTTEQDLEGTARVQRSNPYGDEVYDTHDVDFSDESNCVGTSRTGLDNGNLKIK